MLAARIADVGVFHAKAGQIAELHGQLCADSVENLAELSRVLVIRSSRTREV